MPTLCALFQVVHFVHRWRIHSLGQAVWCRAIQELPSRIGEPTTVNIELRTIKAMFGYAVKWGLLEKSPCRNVQQVRIPEQTPIYLTQDYHSGERRIKCGDIHTRHSGTQAVWRVGCIFIAFRQGILLIRRSSCCWSNSCPNDGPTLVGPFYCSEWHYCLRLFNVCVCACVCVCVC